MRKQPKPGQGTAFLFLEELLSCTHDECVTWPFNLLPNGYGQLGWRGQMWRANRLMLTLAEGPPPSPRHESAHSCGNKACVNPRHLSWKTPKENQADRKRDGTAGNRRGKFVLNRDQAEAIRAMNGIRTQQSLADEYGVTRETVSQIMRRKIWA